MISNINDFLSIALIGLIVVFSLLASIKALFKSKIQKQMQEEIDYYKEW